MDDEILDRLRGRLPSEGDMTGKDVKRDLLNGLMPSAFADCVVLTREEAKEVRRGLAPLCRIHRENLSSGNELEACAECQRRKARLALLSPDEAGDE